MLSLNYVKIKSDLVKVLISKALLSLYISHDKFISVNNIIREHNEMKEEIKNPETTVEYTT